MLNLNNFILLKTKHGSWLNYQYFIQEKNVPNYKIQSINVNFNSFKFE